MSFDFIPNEVVVGKTRDIGWVSCKYKGNKWTGESIFTRITEGFKPHLQRDTVKELKKAICACTDEIKNVPIKGFKLIKYGTSYEDRNIYGISEFNNFRNVIMQDPRGFNIAISVEEFFDLLNETNGMLNHNEIDAELCYCWTSSSSRAQLVSTKNPNYEKVKIESEKILKEKDEAEYVTPSKLEIGKIYKANNDKVHSNGYFVYVGKFDIYSRECQSAAFRYKSYKFYDHFKDDRNDKTGKGKMVFYHLGAKGRYSYSNEDDPYFISSNISKCFFANEDNVDLKKYFMYNDINKNCTLENILDDVAHNLLFNKIKFDVNDSYEPMLYELFEARYKGDCNNSEESNIFWPENYVSSSNFLVNANANTLSSRILSVKMSYYGKLHYSSYPADTYEICHSDTYDESKSYYSGRYNSRAKYASFQKCNLRQVYDALKPLLVVLRLENGNIMNAVQRSGFTLPKCEYNINRRYYDAQI